MQRVDALRGQLTGLVTLSASESTVISWGCPELDGWIPGGGLRAGMIVELLYRQPGSGVGSLALHAAGRVIAEQRAPLVVIDRQQRFYPPAAVARGIEPQNLIMVRPPEDPRANSRAEQRVGMSTAEELWALDQALRCPGVGVVMAWMDRIAPNAYRRLQLAAESGQTLLLLIRPERVRSFPTWADIQLGVSSLPPADASNRDGEQRFYQVTLLRQRGRVGNQASEGAKLHLELDEQGILQVCAGNVQRHAARTMHMAPRVAHPAARRRSAGA